MFLSATVPLGTRGVLEGLVSAVCCLRSATCCLLPAAWCPGPVSRGLFFSFKDRPPPFSHSPFTGPPPSLFNKFSVCVLGLAFGPLWVHFGSHFASILGSLLGCFGVRFRIDLLSEFGCSFWSLWGSFWGRFSTPTSTRAAPRSKKAHLRF